MTVMANKRVLTGNRVPSPNGSARRSVQQLGGKMGILARLFGAKSETTAKLVEHAVIVAFTYIGSTDLGPLFALERQLESDIAAAQAGEYEATKLQPTV